MVGFKELVPRVVDTEADPEGLGRWVSQVIEGAGDHIFRYVAAYKPCINCSKVYTQQETHYHQQGSDREPSQAFLEDLHEALTAWDEAGEKVMIYIDANQDVRQGKVADMFVDLSLQEQITHRHGKRAPAPATHDLNSNNVPIDGIWTNFSRRELRWGFFCFGEGFPDSDHRTAWIDIPFDHAFRHNPPHLHQLHPPTFTTADPRNRKRYNQQVTKRLTLDGIMEKVQLMRFMVKERAPKEDIRKLHQKISIARKLVGKEVAKSLRKKHTGAYPFSPKLSKFIMFNSGPK